MDFLSGKWGLDDLAVISFDGPDAATFLHAQLTNTVIDLPFDQAKPAAYCTAQGRILANCFYWRTDTNSFSVVLAKDLLEAFIKRIKMFVLRSKLSINYLPEYQVTGVSGLENMPADIHKLSGWSVYKDGQSFWIKVPVNNQQANLAWHISKNHASENHKADKSAWYAMLLAAGLPIVRAHSQEKFLPSALNMDLNGYIDFQKGCYPGQEIIARSYYRGTVKRRLAFANGTINAAEENINPSDLYSASTNKPIARVIDFAIYDQQIFIAAEVNLADINETKFLLSPDGVELKLQLI